MATSEAKNMQNSYNRENLMSVFCLNNEQLQAQMNVIQNQTDQSNNKLILLHNGQKSIQVWPF